MSSLDSPSVVLPGVGIGNLVVIGIMELSIVSSFAETAAVLSLASCSHVGPFHSGGQEHW